MKFWILKDAIAYQNGIRSFEIDIQLKTKHLRCRTINRRYSNNFLFSVGSKFSPEFFIFSILYFDIFINSVIYLIFHCSSSRHHLFSHKTSLGYQCKIFVLYLFFYLVAIYLDHFYFHPVILLMISETFTLIMIQIFCFSLRYDHCILWIP